MSTLRCFAHKDATVPANLPDLGEFRGMQECYTRQNTAMTVKDLRAQLPIALPKRADLMPSAKIVVSPIF